MEYNKNKLVFKVILNINSLVRLKIFFFNRIYSNKYLEFFKNLPNSFASKTNYQVSILFTTIQSSTNNDFKSVCVWAHLFLREIFQAINW